MRRPGCCCSLGSRAAQVYWLAKCHTPLASAIWPKDQAHNLKPPQHTRHLTPTPTYSHTATSRDTNGAGPLIGPTVELEGHLWCIGRLLTRLLHSPVAV